MAWLRRLSVVLLLGLFVASSSLLASGTASAEEPQQTVSLWGSEAPPGMTSPSSAQGWRGTHFRVPAGTLSALKLHGGGRPLNGSCEIRAYFNTAPVSNPFSGPLMASAFVDGLTGSWNTIALGEPVEVTAAQAVFVVYRCVNPIDLTASGFVPSGAVASAETPDLVMVATTDSLGRSWYAPDTGSLQKLTTPFGVDLEVTLPPAPVDPTTPTLTCTEAAPCWVKQSEPIVVPPMESEVSLAPDQWKEVLLALGALVFFSAGSFVSEWRHGRGS